MRIQSVPMMMIMMMIIPMAYEQDLTIDQSACTSPLLSNANPMKPKGSLREETTSGGQFNICGNMKQRKSCCSDDGIFETEKMFNSSYDSLDRRNYEVMFRLNEMMVQTLKNKNRTLEMANDLNGLLRDASDGQMTVQEYYDNLRSGNELSLSDIPLPTRLEEYREQISQVIDEVSSYDVDLNSYFNEVQNIPLFENSTYFELQELENGRQVRQFNMDKLDKEFDQIQIRMRQLVTETSKCFSTLGAHVLGVRCATCDPSTYSYFEYSLRTAEMKLYAKTQMCSDISNSCYDYLNLMEQMNQNIVLNIFAETASTYNVTITNDNSTEFDKAQQAVTQLITQQDAFGRIIDTMLFYAFPSNCISKQDCDYLCQKVVTPLDLNLDQIFLNPLYLNQLVLIRNYTQNITDIFNDILNNTNNDNNDNNNDDNNNPNRLMQETEQDILPEPNIIYTTSSNSFSTVEYAKTTQYPLLFDGTSRLNIFNLSSTATLDDLYSYKPTQSNQQQSFFQKLQSILDQPYQNTTPMDNQY